MAGTGERSAPRPRLLTPLFLLVTLSTFAYFVSQGALIPVLPRYVEGPLGGGSVAVGWAVGAFSISAVVLRPLAGRLGDRRGRRLLIVGGASVAGLSVVAYVPSASLGSLIALRLLTGVGEALFFTGAASAVNDLAPEDRRGEAVSLFSLALYGGLVVGPLLGEATLGRDRFDAVWVVAAVLSVAAALVGAGLRETRDPGVGDAGGPLLHRAGLVPGVVIGASVTALAGFATFVPLYVFELGLAGSRFVFALLAGLILLIRLFGARIPDRLGAVPTATLSLTLSVVGLLIAAAWSSVAGLYAGTVVLAVGQSLAFPALMTIAVRAAPAAERGAAIGTFTAFVDVAFGVGPIGLGAVAAVAGYPGVFAVAACVVAGGLAVLRRGPARSVVAAGAAEPVR